MLHTACHSQWRCPTLSFAPRLNVKIIDKIINKSSINLEDVLRWGGNCADFKISHKYSYLAHTLSFVSLIQGPDAGISKSN